MPNCDGGGPFFTPVLIQTNPPNQTRMPTSPPAFPITGQEKSDGQWHCSIPQVCSIQHKAHSCESLSSGADKPRLYVSSSYALLRRRMCLFGMQTGWAAAPPPCRNRGEGRPRSGRWICSNFRGSVFRPKTACGGKARLLCFCPWHETTAVNFPRFLVAIAQGGNGVF